MSNEKLRKAERALHPFDAGECSNEELLAIARNLLPRAAKDTWSRDDIYAGEALDELARRLAEQNTDTKGSA